MTTTIKGSNCSEPNRHEPPKKSKGKGLDFVHLYYSVFVAVIISLLTGAVKMGVIAFTMFVLLSASFLYIMWMVYVLFSRLWRFIYRTYLRGYLSGIKRAKQDLEKDE